MAEFPIDIATFLEQLGDPAAAASKGKFYTKDAGGVTQLFYRASDGTVTQLTPGGTLPALAGVQFAALIENPIGTLVFQKLNEDMIDPGFSIASFVLTSPVTAALLRRGDTITGPMTVDATYVSGPPTAASLLNILGGSVGGGDINPGVWTFLAPYASGGLVGNVLREGSDAGADPTWTIQLDASNGGVGVATRLTTWTRDEYWGYGAAGVPGTLAGAQINALANTVLSPSRARTLTFGVGANQKAYYAYPSALGALTSATSGGFPFVWSAGSPFTVTPVTNVNGIVSTYFLYESENFISSDLSGAAAVVVV